MKHFHLDRKVDETGMSGTGKVAEGVVLDNGLAVMWWLVPPNSVQVYPSISDLENIHSHGKGTTRVVYDSIRSIKEIKDRISELKQSVNSACAIELEWVLDGPSAKAIGITNGQKIMEEVNRRVKKKEWRCKEDCPNEDGYPCIYIGKCVNGVPPKEISDWDIQEPRQVCQHLKDPGQCHYNPTMIAHCTYENCRIRAKEAEHVNDE